MRSPFFTNKRCWGFVRICFLQPFTKRTFQNTVFTKRDVQTKKISQWHPHKMTGRLSLNLFCSGFVGLLRTIWSASAIGTPCCRSRLAARYRCLAARLGRSTSSRSWLGSSWCCLQHLLSLGPSFNIEIKYHNQIKTSVCAKHNQ